MNHFISRSTEAPPRVFPPVGPKMYDLSMAQVGLSRDQQTTIGILALANNELPFLGRLLGRQLRAEQAVGRLLSFHKLALQAELDGNQSRADYFWTDVQEQMRTLAGADEIWRAAVKFVAATTNEDLGSGTLAWSRRLVDEVLIDTHCALYNSLVKQEATLSWQSRAFFHIQAISALVPISGMTHADLLTVLVPAFDQWIILCQKAGKLDQAVELCTELLHYLPDLESYRERLVQLCMARTLAGLQEGRTSKGAAANVSVLRQGIDAVVQVKESYPHNVAAFDTLALLYHQLAINAWESGSLAEALLSANKAVAHNPRWQEAIETKETLSHNMTILQEQISEIEAKLRNRPGARLNAKGLKMRHEVQRGFNLVNVWRASGEAEAATKGYFTAQGRDLWKRIGLEDPASDWDELAWGLLVGLSSITSDPPETLDGLAEAWSVLVEQNENLAVLDGTLICAFLKRKLFETNESQEIVDSVLVSAAVSQEPPIMAATSANYRRGSEPVNFWLLSGRDKRIKLLAVLAIFLVLVVGGLTINSLSVRATRDTAYQQIIAAVEEYDYPSIIEHADTFLAVSPVIGSDGREKQVAALYSEALVRWLASIEGELDVQSQARVARYRELVPNEN